MHAHVYLPTPLVTNVSEVFGNMVSFVHTHYWCKSYRMLKHMIFNSRRAFIMCLMLLISPIFDTVEIYASSSVVVISSVTEVSDLLSVKLSQYLQFTVVVHRLSFQPRKESHSLGLDKILIWKHRLRFFNSSYLFWSYYKRGLYGVQSTL